jgi:RNA polymerase sigma-32 factor
MLSAEEELRLSTAAKYGSKPAADRLCRSHILLVRRIAKEFSVHGLSAEDVISEGVLGLVEAARRFDPDQGVRFAAYAAYWIRAYIRKFTIRNRRIVRMPETRMSRRLLARLRTTQRDLAQQNGERPDAWAVAEALGCEAWEVEEIEAVLSNYDALGGENLDECDVVLPAQTESPEAIAADDEERARRRAVLHDALQQLPARDRDILYRRYLNDDTASMAEVGKDLGISRERVRQLEQRALQACGGLTL